MWNKHRSVILTIALVIVFLILLTAFTVSAYRFLPYLIREDIIRYDDPAVLLIGSYACVPFAYAALILLLRLLLRVKKGEVFCPVNVLSLRVLSWCCFAVGVITLIGGFWWFPAFAVSAAAFFMGLILRVVKSVLAYGTDIKKEQDLTI